MGKSELLLVELKDGTLCRIAKAALNVFLSRGEVVRFKRSDGWIVVATGQLRDKKNDGAFNGVERRELP